MSPSFLTQVQLQNTLRPITMYIYIYICTRGMMTLPMHHKKKKNIFETLQIQTRSFDHDLEHPNLFLTTLVTTSVNRKSTLVDRILVLSQLRLAELFRLSKYVSVKWT